MNKEDLSIRISLIKNEKIRDYLFRCLQCEFELKFTLSSSLIEKSTQRFENKIEFCEQIENDFPNRLIPVADNSVLGTNFEILKLMLSKLYDVNSRKIIEYNYDEIKSFINKLLNLQNFPLKSKYLYLTITLLEKLEADRAAPHFNKEFVGAFDVLKKFVTENKYIPDEADLKYVSLLDRKGNENLIRKSFYRIIHELDKKLLLKDVLKQLLQILKNNSPFIQFTTIFINKCLEDAEMDVTDLHQAVQIIHSALKNYNKQFKTKKISTIFKQNLIDLSEFEKDLQEKISLSLIDNLVIQSSQNEKLDPIFHLFGFFFNDDVSKKIKDKLAIAKDAYNQTVAKKTADHSSIQKSWRKISTSATTIMVNAKDITSALVKNLEDLKEKTNSKFLMISLIEKDSETLNSHEVEGTDEIDINNSLMETKITIIAIRKKLKSWNSQLNKFMGSQDNQYNCSAKNQINVDSYSKFVIDLDTSINKKYNSLNEQIIEKVKSNLKNKANWLEKPEINKKNLMYKIFYRGYFNINFSIEKLKAQLGSNPSFDKAKKYISEQSFWTLLFTYRIVRWPWMNKAFFAYGWAEQLCLPGVINKIEELSQSNNNNQDLLEEIIALLKAFPHYKTQVVDDIINNFNKDIVFYLSRLKTIELKINECLSKKINVARTSGMHSSANCSNFFDFPLPPTNLSNQSFPLILAN